MDNDGLILKVKIITPKQVVYEGDASSISSINSQGRFDILPEHANFITMIQNQPIEVVDSSNKLQTFKFTQAIIYNADNKVSVFAEPLTNPNL